MKIGILGYGYMGTIRRRVLDERSDVEVVRVFHTADGPFTRVPRWEDIADDRAIDAVFVCLPNHLTAPATMRALGAGKHVFAEKPPGVSLAEAEQMAAAARASGTTLQFGFNLRQHPAVRALASKVSSKELGVVRWIRGAYGKPKSTDFENEWRADPALAGGGILLDQGIHLLDVMLMLQSDLAVAHAIAGAHDGARVEDDMMVLLRGAAGAVASLHSSHTQSPPTFRLEVGFSAGRARLDGLLTRSGRYGPEQITWAKSPDAAEHVETFSSDDSWAREVDAFVEATRTGAPPLHGSSAQAIALMRIVERIHACAGHP